MPCEYAPVDFEILKRPLSLLARKFSYQFPERLMDHNDLMQSGFLGAIRVPFQEKDTPTELIKRQVIAAKHQMIDTMRSFSDPRYPNGRRMEWAVGGIERFSAEDTVSVINEDEHLQYEELLRLASTLKEWEQKFLRDRLHGSTLLELAKGLSLTEGRASQIQSKIAGHLRKGLKY